MSSITWPLDSAYVVSYWWSIVTMHLSCIVTEIWGPKILESRPWPFGVTWRHRSRDHWTRHLWFPIGGPLEPCVYLAPLQRYKASNLHLPVLKAKSSLRMLRVTWPVGRGSKMTTYLEFSSPYCLFTIQLLWGYDDDSGPFVGENFIHRHVFKSQDVDSACPMSRDLWVGGPKWPHIWNSRGHIVSSLYNFYGPKMMIRGHL